MNSFLANDLCCSVFRVAFFKMSFFCVCFICVAMCLFVCCVCVYVHMNVKARGILQHIDGLALLADELFSVTQFLGYWWVCCPGCFFIWMLEVSTHAQEPFPQSHILSSKV